MIYEIIEQVLVKKRYYIQAESRDKAMHFFKTQFIDAHEEIREPIFVLVGEVKADGEEEKQNAE